VYKLRGESTYRQVLQGKIEIRWQEEGEGYSAHLKFGIGLDEVEVPCPPADCNLKVSQLSVIVLLIIPNYVVFKLPFHNCPAQCI
jgi:hypothetical protein